ncbi:MAG: hemolysin III family protein [Isosphaeraceae bacterium]
MSYLDFREPFSAWSHGLWLLLSVPATVLLWRRCGGNRAKRFTLLIFGLSLAACSLGSTLYHGVRVGNDGLELFDRLDHVGIHLLIAGSYTPLAWNLLRGHWRWGTLLAVWSSTLVGSGLLLANIRLPGPLQTCEYMALGWGALLCYCEMARVISHRAMRPLVLGGVFYSIGALLNLMEWPNLWPGVFGPHEMFHLWVMAGSAFHFWFMLTAVVPFACAYQTSAIRGDHPSGSRTPSGVGFPGSPFPDKLYGE